MYEYIRGSIAKVDTTGIVLDIHGVGYRIQTLQQTIQKAIAIQSTTKELHLFIEFLVREESHTLYGFMTEIERMVFRLLLGISGIGAKLAIQIMNRGSLTELLEALSHKDIPWLSSISGIGKKTAERIALEAADRAKELFLDAKMEIGGAEAHALADYNAERKLEKKSFYTHGVEALTSLGLSEAEATRCIQEAVTHAKQQNNEEINDLGRLIQLALLHRKRRA